MGEQTSEDARRSTRVSLSVPIVISGKDVDQNDFREETRTLVVNEHGAKIVTVHQLAMGAEILIENPALSTSAKATVAWVGPEYRPGELHQVGLQLYEPRNVWGIEFRPDDWSAGTSVGGALTGATPASGPEPAARSIAGALVPETARESLAGQLRAVAEEIATRFLQELQGTAEAQAREFQERLGKLAQRIGMQLEVDLHERATAAKEQEIGAIVEQVRSVAGRLSAAKEEVERLEAQTQELQRNLQPVAEKAPLISSQMQEARRQLTDLTNSVVGSMNQAAAAGLEEYRRRLEKELQEQTARGRSGAEGNPQPTEHQAAES
jgi:archaellum component FlaC